MYHFIVKLCAKMKVYYCIFLKKLYKNLDHVNYCLKFGSHKLG